MNERIQELRAQVKMDLTKFNSDPEFYKKHVAPLSNIFENGDNALLNEYMTKFAELIVQECIEAMYNTEQMNVAKFVALTLQEHFGLEE